MVNKKFFMFLVMSVFLLTLVSAGVTYTPGTDTTCNQVNGETVCTKTLWSGVRNVYEDDQWKKVEDARSLMNQGFEINILEFDEDFPVEVVDFNLTSITVKLNPKGIKIFGEDIPVRIWKQDKDKEEKFNEDVKDGKKISKGLKDDYKETYKKVKDEEISFWLLNQGEERTYNFGLDTILEFGYNSTIVKLQVADVDNLEDVMIMVDAPFFEFTDYITMIKFNISSIPAGVITENVTLSVYVTSNSTDGDANFYNINNQTWSEDYTAEQLKVMTKSDRINTASFISGTGWMTSPNLTSLFLVDYNLGNSNFSIWIEDPDNNATTQSKELGTHTHLMIGSYGELDVFGSKEYEADTSLRPYLNITYSLPPLGISITHPTNTTYTTNVTFLNWTVGGAEEDYCWYSLNGGTANTTLTCGDLYTNLALADGSHTIDIWANDTGGTEVWDNVTFWMDTILPNLNIVNPTGGFIWYGWDTDGNNTILVDLNWTSYDINADKCWYTNNNSENVTVTCGDNATTLIPYSTVDWYVWANDTSSNIGSDIQTTRYAALINNSHTGNTTTYETKTETFAVNLTYPSSEFTISAKLNYSGTLHTATRTGSGDFAVFTYTLDVPTVGVDVTNHTYNFNISLNNGTQFYYVTDERNITVTPIIFQECNGTFLPFLNYTFKDEETDIYISASVPNADFDFWLGSGSVKDSYNFADAVDTTSYEFCFSLNETINIDLVFQYEQDPGYTVRTESYAGTLSNDTTYKILFLTGTSNGQYITFQLQNSAGTGIPDAIIQVERKIGGAWTTIGTDDSDDAGQVIFYLDITLDHRLTITHDDYATEILTIRPSQAVYTIILQLVGGEPAEYTSPLEGINYYISPTPGPWLSENTNYTFTYNISANLSNLIFYSMNITLQNGTELASVYGTTSTGGDLTIFLNTSDYNRLYGYYYIDVGNGTFLIDPSIWVLRDITPGNSSIYAFFVYLKSTETDIEDNYTHLFFLFFFFFLAMAAFTLSTGMELAQPGICLVLVVFFVAICSLTGYFTIDFAPGDFINQYGILLVVSLLTGGYTLGQWART